MLLEGSSHFPSLFWRCTDMTSFSPFGGILIATCRRCGTSIRRYWYPSVWGITIRIYSLRRAASLTVVWELQIPLLVQLSAPLFAVVGLTIQCGPDKSQDFRSVEAFEAK